MDKKHYFSATRNDLSDFVIRFARNYGWPKQRHIGAFTKDATSFTLSVIEKYYPKHNEYAIFDIPPDAENVSVDKGRTGEMVFRRLTDSSSEIRFLTLDEETEDFFVALILDLSSAFNLTSSGTIEGKVNTRQKAPRKDAIERVAFAVYQINIGKAVSKIGAAKFARTSVATINKYEDHPSTLELVKKISRESGELTKLRKKILRSTKSRKEVK